MLLSLITREDAKAAGLKRYFNAEPCVLGHVTERYVVNQRCLECSAIARKKHRSANPNRVREKRKAYAEARREVLNQQSAAWREANPQKVAAAMRKWKEKNPERQREYQRSRREQRNESLRRCRRERYATDPLYVLQSTARTRIGDAFRKGGFKKTSSTAQIIGCTWPELKRHIERQFLRGMTWENRGRVWHVDHIRPIAEAKSSADVEALCHFTNLRPLWALDNQKKSAKRTHLI